MRGIKVIRARVPEPHRQSRWLQAFSWLTSTVTYVLALGLVLGALVHIFTVFAIPHLRERDAVSLLIQMSGKLRGKTQAIHESGFIPPWPDPAFVTSYCHFDLTHGPVQIKAQASDVFAGLSLHGIGGGVLYAVTDEIAQDEMLSITILTAEQVLDHPKESSGELRFIMPTQIGMGTVEGIAVYRVMAPLPSLREKANLISSTLHCNALKQVASNAQ